MEVKSEPGSFLDRIVSRFKRKENLVDPRIDEFVARAKVVYPDRKEEHAASFAKYLIEHCGKALPLHTSAENLGSFRKELLYATYASRITERPVAHIVTFELKMIEKHVKEAKKKASSDIESAAIFVSEYVDPDRSEEEAKRIYKGIMDAKPATIWDVIMLDPEAMFPTEAEG